MKRSTWGRKAGAFVAAAAMLFATACGGGGAGGETANGGETAPAAEAGEAGEGASGGSGELSGEFVLWTWEPEHPTMMKAFQEKYPNIKMKRVEVAAEDVTTKLQTTIASGGELPDVIRIERGQRAKIFDMDVLQNLEEPPYNVDKSLLFDYDVDVFSPNGHMVAIPDDMSVTGLAYIRDLAKEYFGTDNPEELEAMFQDWETLIEKGKEVDAKSGGEVKLFRGLGDIYMMLTGQRSGPYFDGDKLNKAVLEDVLRKLVAFRDAGVTDKLDQWTPAWNASFSSDKYIFSESPVWMPQYVIAPNDQTEGRWGLMVPPGGGLIHGGSSHGIPKGAKNAELAWKWIEFNSLTQEGAEAAKVDGVFTHFEAAYEDPAFANWTWPNFGSQDIGEKFFVDIAAVTRDIPENVNDLLLNEVMNIVIQTLNKDPNFGFDEAMAAIEKELKAKSPAIVIE